MADDKDKKKEAPRLYIENVPGLPDGYADEITPSERASWAISRPDALHDLELKEAEHAKEHGGKAPAKTKRPDEVLEPYQLTSTPEKLAAYLKENDGKLPEKPVTVVVKLPEPETPEILPSANVTVKSGSEVISESTQGQPAHPGQPVHPAPQNKSAGDSK